MNPRYRFCEARAILQAGGFMRTAIILMALCTGCSAEQGFGENQTSAVEEGGEGRVEIFPTDGVIMGPFDIGHTEVGGFRIDSVGDFPLKVSRMALIDVGQNAGTGVFGELRPHVSTNTVPFDIEPGEGAEFLLTASMSEAGTATGTIEIYTNDPTVNDGGPGYVRIPLKATAVDPNGEPEDTGSADSADTGDAESDESSAEDTASGGTTDAGSGDE